MAFYFAWADADETTFAPTHKREDEDVFDLVIQHDEGQFPTAEVGIRNPRIGLLNPGRQVWAWISYDDGATVTPLFFGRLVGIPDNLIGDVCTLRFVARPRYYYTVKQAAAQALKVRPFYDPLFLSPEKRDDADAILEGYSSLWHIDRTTHAVTTSDVLVGEDGTEVFAENDVPYDSVSISVEQPPLQAVQIIADVQWSQSYSGYVNIGERSFESYAGDGILGDWPKPLTNLGGGWTAAYSVAHDIYRVDKAETITENYEWQNQAKKHRNGDTMSISYQATTPLLPFGSISAVTSKKIQVGWLDMNAKDADGDPAPINRPASGQVQTAYVPIWRVNTALIARYDAARSRTEKLYMTVESDVQAVITDDGTRDVEQISLSGGDVGMPIADVLRWSTVSGQAVELGQVIFPDEWLGAATAQICTTAGTAGIEPPEFSDLAGFTTSDGTVTWTSLGGGGSLGSAPDWQENSYTPLGTVILPRTPLSIPYDWLTAPGRIDYPSAGVNVNQGTIVETYAGYQQCVYSGTTDEFGAAFSGTPGGMSIDGSVLWKCIGPKLPDASTFYICTAAGISGDVLPAFDNTEGATTSDGTVEWTSLGMSEVPIGGSVGSTGRNAYFPTDRGLHSVEYLLCLARARLRLRARVVRVSFDVAWSRALALTCRKNATLNDPRMPGGVATGKIIGYTLSANGDSGELKGTVTLGCAVGNGTALSLVTGVPGYVDAGYVASGYQYTSDQIAANDDLGYTPPAVGADPDALSFPLTRGQAVKFERIHGSLGEQEMVVREALNSQIEGGVPPNDFGLVQAAKISVADALKKVPIWYELELANLTGGPYEAVYFVETTPLVVPKSIDLGAAA